MGYVSSTCTSLTPITNTNGSWSPTDVSFEFYDPHGSAFKMAHGSGSFGYQGLRTNAKYKFFRMTYEWRGTSGGYLGSFWGNTSSTYIGGGRPTTTPWMPCSSASLPVWTPPPPPSLCSLTTASSPPETPRRGCTASIALPQSSWPGAQVCRPRPWNRVL